ncbi:MAG: hypothetical protein KJZ54_03335 [Phycisphaerales bacterium]|nr:hypothetical protein [Phycisphaerales bacterium]
MGTPPSLLYHAFRFRGRRVRLAYSIDYECGKRRLVLDDVLAPTQRLADAVPDWRIEAELEELAHDLNAQYG